MIYLESRPVLQLCLRGISSLLTVAFILFVSAGTINYPEAWIFLVVLSFCSLSFFIWLYIYHRKQLYNRLMPREPDKTQRKLLVLIGFTLCAALIISGLDKRFGLSTYYKWRFAIAGILLITAVVIYIDVFKRNPFLSNTVEIHEKQSVVMTGSYAIVRHPMYLATILTCASGMIILGSLLNSALFIVIILLINVRINFEEKQLFAAVPQYVGYSEKVKHKLIPIAFLHR